jgi:hypothetical protein
LKETRLAYVAGLIDADGSLYISKAIRKDGYVSYDPIVMVRSTHLPTVKWLVNMFGGTYDTGVWDNPNWKTYYRWKFSGDKHAARFLDKILPYLWLKKAQAKVLKTYYELGGMNLPAVRESLYQSTTKLNQNESVTTNTSRLPFLGNILAAYLAGMFDGEGSSYIIKVKQGRGDGYYYRACISLGSTCKSLAEELQRVYGGGWRKRPPHNGILPMYEWSVTTNVDKERFLLATIPYLHTKTEQSKIVLQFVRMSGEINPEKRRACWLKCSALNGNKRESELVSDHESDPSVS